MSKPHHRSIRANPRVAVEPGRFDRARTALKERFGEELAIYQMLEGDARWIELWIALANTLKHPKPNERLIVNDMRLLPNRQIQLPTWQLVHPKLDLERPQAILEPCEIVISNLLGLFENIFVELIQAVLPDLPVGLQWIVEDKEENDRNPVAPSRYSLSIAKIDNA